MIEGATNNFNNLTTRVLTGDTDLWWGYNVTVGDFNGDGRDDIAVSVDDFDKNPATDSDEGAIYIYLGGFSGVSLSPNITILGRYEDGWLGYEGLNNLGDIDGDGADDCVDDEPNCATNDTDECGVCAGTNECFGCMDGNAWNYNDESTIDDGSCYSDTTCDDCEFDWTPYGAECCDAAWDDFGINCEALEGNYNWDCSGCACPGDEVWPPEDCTVFDCVGAEACGYEGWQGDGYCDCLLYTSPSPRDRG